MATEIQFPGSLKIFLLPFFGFHTTSFSTGAQSYAVKSPTFAGVAVTVKPKIHVGLTEVSSCRATTASCHLWMPPFYTPLMGKSFLVCHCVVKKGLNWSGMQKGFTSKPLFCSLTPLLQPLMHENGLCCVLLCMDFSEGLNMQKTTRLSSLMISSASFWGVMEDSTKDQQIFIDTPSVKDECIIKTTKIKKKKGNYFLCHLWPPMSNSQTLPLIQHSNISLIKDITLVIYRL